MPSRNLSLVVVGAFLLVAGDLVTTTTNDRSWGEIFDAAGWIRKVNREDLWRAAAKELGVAAKDIPTATSRGVETFFDGYGHDSISHWFIGNLAMWRVLYFGDTKYKPGDIEEGAAAPQAETEPA